MTDGTDDFIRSYRHSLLRNRLFIIVGIIACVIVFGMELGFGTFHIGFFESYNILLDHILGYEQVDPWSIKADNVIWNMRVPRAIGAIAVGAGLGVCGCAMQSSLKNPLADPYTTGISSGASLGASLAIILGLTVVAGGYSDAGLIANAFVFSLIPSAVIILMTAFKKKVSTTAIILIGIAVMYTFSAITTLLKYVATEDSIQDLYYWGLGMMGKIDWDNVGVIVLAALFDIIVFQYMAKSLNILSMTEDNANTLGVDRNKTRTRILIVVSLVTSVMVCFTGTIGFVGLIAPHIARMFIKNNNKYLVPASAVTGALVLICADLISKNLTATGMPIGLITSLIGGPLFLFLLIRQRKSNW